MNMIMFCFVVNRFHAIHVHFLIVYGKVLGVLLATCKCHDFDKFTICLIDVEVVNKKFRSMRKYTPSKVQSFKVVKSKSSFENLSESCLSTPPFLNINPPPLIKTFDNNSTNKVNNNIQYCRVTTCSYTISIYYSHKYVRHTNSFL